MEGMAPPTTLSLWDWKTKTENLTQGAELSRAPHSCPQLSHRTPAGIIHMPGTPLPHLTTRSPPPLVRLCCRQGLLYSRGELAGALLQAKRMGPRESSSLMSSLGRQLQLWTSGHVANSLMSWRWRRGPAGSKKETWLEGFWCVSSRDPRPEERMVVTAKQGGLVYRRWEGCALQHSHRTATESL